MKTRAKSLRFSEAEEKEIAAYVQLTGEQEAVVMERLAMRGLREERLERALMAYAGGATSSEAAAMAAMARHAFLVEATERGINMLRDDPAVLLQDLGRVADLFQDERLREAVARVSQQLAGNVR